MDTVDRVMVDIETLGLEPGSAILSIGAVRFDRDGLGDTFGVNVDLASCEEAGLTIDADTLEWWLGQDSDVQHVLTGGKPLSKSLFEFGSFYGDADEIWAFSPSFDCKILKDAYEAVGEAPPWSYKDERDCRTLASLPVWPGIEQEGSAHDALDDAKYQARATSMALQELHSDGAVGEAGGAVL